MHLSLFLIFLTFPPQQEREGLNIMALTLERGNEKAAYLFADDSPLDRIDSVTSLPIPR